MAANEGFRRMRRLSLVLAYCSPVGLAIWLIQFFTLGRWGIMELLLLGLVPILMAGGLRMVTWLLAGFFQE
jgi:hypothetical protein